MSLEELAGLKADLGAQRVGIGGGSRTVLDLGAYRGRILDIDLRTPQGGSGKSRIYVKIAVTDAPISDKGNIGKEFETSLAKTEGSDFSQDTKEGKANRARIAEIKALLAASVKRDDKMESAIKAIEEKNGDFAYGASLAKRVGSDLTFYYEPPVEGDETLKFPVIHWLTETSFLAVAAGKQKVTLKNVAKIGGPTRPQTPRDEYISAGAASASSAKKPAASEDDIDI